MHYLPDTVILNNVEFDHADIYRDLVAVKFAFSRLINLIPGRGRLIAGWDSEVVRELAPRAFCPLERFGIEGDLDWRATDIDYSGEFTSFTVLAKGSDFGRYNTTLAGLYNVQNCLSVIAACEGLGLDRVAVRKALAEFKSVKRRMEVRGQKRGVTVIDDFAHHPTAVRETLMAARQRYIGQRLVAVFEPRSYTAQRRDFQEAFEEGLAQADKIIIAGLFHPDRYAEGAALRPDDMVRALRSRELEADYIPSPDDIVTHLVPHLRKGDVVVVMSNGAFGGIHEQLLRRLEDTNT
jgi:UDP-N-acetylmuramate: L-alanyl-gamma-D-glutamyl-meso-diaminopimelate ligase